MRVLLIEDDSATAQSIELMLKSEGFNVYTTDLGEEGVDLGKIYDYDLILLDLNLPRKDGREVLAEIKKDDDLGRIPVVVLTTSSADEDILRSYQLHANAYVTKPVDFERFIAVIRQIDEFFVSVVKLPPRA